MLEDGGAQPGGGPRPLARPDRVDLLTGDVDLAGLPHGHGRRWSLPKLLDGLQVPDHHAVGAVEEG